MQSDQSKTTHLRHAPILDWILQTLLSIVCLLIGFGLFGVVLRIVSDPYNLDTTLILLCTAVATLSAGIYIGRIVITSAVSEAKIDPSNKWVEVTRFRIYGRRSDRYHFHQIEKFKSYKAKRFLSLPSPNYALELILINKKKIRIRVVIGTEKAGTTKFIKSLNKMIRNARSSQDIGDKR